MIMSANKTGHPLTPCVTYAGALDMQVCVALEWTNEQVVTFANNQNPCGTVYGWKIRKQGSPMLGGCPERSPCDDVPGNVHIMLDA